MSNETKEEKQNRLEREKVQSTHAETKAEILKAAGKLSPGLKEAIENDYYNAGKPVPQTIVELLNVVLTFKKK